MINPSKFIALIASLALATEAKIAASVKRALAEGGMADVMVAFKDNVQLNNMVELDAMPKAARTEAIMNTLTNQVAPNAAEVQTIINNVVTTNSKACGKTDVFWISNSMFIADAAPELLEAIMLLPNVADIRSPVIAQLHVEPEVFPAANATAENANGWNLDLIKAPEAWRKGFKGQGVVVANIDTGVRHTHEALRRSYRPQKGWLDPYGNTATPSDQGGHGTHTMGSIVGSMGIGVAPEATWIACKGCDGGCSSNALTKCAEFVMCPEGDCSKGADVVNNSWGSTDATSTWYRKSVDAWRKAGIIPIFSNGNSGPSCSTVGSPGSYDNVIGVGASGQNEKLARFSSRGPAPRSLLKPDITGPGSQIRSAKHTGDGQYQSMSGTSMSAPHLTGVVALILSAFPGASYETVKQKLQMAVDNANIRPAGERCGGTSDSSYPNNSWGYGRTCALKAVGGGSGPTPTPTYTPTPSPTYTPPTPTTSNPGNCGSCKNCYYPPSKACFSGWSKAQCDSVPAFDWCG